MRAALFYARPGTSVSADAVSINTGNGEPQSIQQKTQRETATVFDFMTEAQRVNCSSSLGTIDVTTAVQAALNSGVGTFPKGVYLISATLTTPYNVNIIGSGGRKTLIKASANFLGNTVFRLGNPILPYDVVSVSMSRMTIDLQTNVDSAYDMYGLQDGSEFDSVYVLNVRKFGTRSFWSVSGTASVMNQGLKISNCHNIGRKDGGVISNGAYWDLSGLYESTLINCKALGFDASGCFHNTVDGFRIGGVNVGGLGDADCQGVRMYNCSSANFYPDPAYNGNANRGIFFGNAFNCSSNEPTIENVKGKAVVFGQATSVGTASDQYSASRCRVVSPRLWNPANDVAINATAIEFSGNASQCIVFDVPTFSAMATQKMVAFLGNCASCRVEIMGGNIQAANAGTYIDFTSADPSNIVTAFTNDTTTKQQTTLAKSQYTIDRLANGTIVEHTQFYSQYKLAQDLRFSKGDGTQILTIKTDGTVQFNKAALPTSAVGNAGVVWMDVANGNTLKVI